VDDNLVVWPRPEARARLFCFPHAGGTASVFNTMAMALPEAVEPWLIRMRGREGRHREPPFQTWPELAEELAEAVAAHSGPPSVLLGVCSGGLLAFGVAQALDRAGHPPAGLVVVDYPPPHRANLGELARLADLPAEALWDEERDIAEVPAVIRKSAGLRRQFETVLRADFRALGDFPLTRSLTRSRLSVPLSVLVVDVARSRRDRFDEWAEYTSGPFTSTVITGDGNRLQRPELPAEVERFVRGLHRSPAG
jgi:surfactin synthase thioesterase subunit